MEKRRSSIYAGCYGLAYFSFVVLKLLYSTFSVTVFLQGFHLRLEWFYFGQAVLGAWNAVDDSLCAVLASYVHRCAHRSACWRRQSKRDPPLRASHARV